MVAIHSRSPRFVVELRRTIGPWCREVWCGVAASMDYDVCVLSFVSVETMTSGNVEILTCRALFRSRLHVLRGNIVRIQRGSQSGQEGRDDAFNRFSGI